MVIPQKLFLSEEVDDISITMSFVIIVFFFLSEEVDDISITMSFVIIVFFFRIIILLLYVDDNNHF